MILVTSSYSGFAFTKLVVCQSSLPVINTLVQLIRIDIKGLSSTYLVNSGMPYPARYSVKYLIAVLSDVALIPSKGENPAGLCSGFRYIIETHIPTVEFVGEVNMTRLA